MKCSIISPLILSSSFFSSSLGFQLAPSRAHNYYGGVNSLRASVAVSIAELEKELTPAERSITSVVRKCGPSVAYVTSVLPPPSILRRKREGDGNDIQNGALSGRSLGSGSGFQVSPGYVCTNYHVIERAYSMQQSTNDLENLIEQLSGNATRLLPEALVNATKSKLLDALNDDEMPSVYVRINSDTEYKKCGIVSVEPDLDLAVLKIESTKNIDPTSVVSFGSSSDLLVGQTLVAIGNPFGLDKTVTTGVVSAVNREFRAGTARTPANTPIRNCIQTDAAINPGNSGGPLLNLKGEVVGINTAIITTSGSNAGIGFAVPSDQLMPVVDRIIQNDRIQHGDRRDRGWLGASCIKQAGNSTLNKNWVKDVEDNSPADLAGIQGISILENGEVVWGDAIVAVAGNEVSTFKELQAELDERVQGEQISLTLESYSGERRVVYLELSVKPM